MSGRASGRARGIAPGLEGSPETTPGRSPNTGTPSPTRSGDSPTNPTFRGRGGVLVTRPPNTETSQGKGGREIQLFANHFELMVPKGDIVQSYHVSFEPDLESSLARKKLVGGQRERFNNSYIFDGMSNIKSFVRFPEDLTSIEVMTEQGTSQIIKFKWVEAIGFGSQEMIRLYNTQMRRNFQHLKWLMIFRHYYNPKSIIKLDQYNLTIWGGMSTAIHEFDGGIQMVCDTVNKLVRNETALNVLRLAFQQNREDFKAEAQRQLVGRVIMTRYNNKSYRIDDIDFSKSPMSTFAKRGVETSFEQYFQEQYNQTVTDKRQPMIVCMPSAREKRMAEQRGQVATPCLLVPEFCLITGLSERDKSNFTLKKTLTESTQFPPDKRYTMLKSFSSALKENENVREEMSRWKLAMSSDCVSVTGRQMEGEKVMMSGMWGKDQGVAYNNGSGDFSRETRSHKMFVPASWSDWSILFAPKDQAVAADFSNTLNRVCGPMGVNLPKPNMVALSNDRTGTYLDALSKLGNSEKHFVVCILPNNSADRYDAIKKHCCIQNPKPSQCAVSKTLSNPKNLMTVCTKIGIQMSAKVGGQPWGFFIPVPAIMVCGYDTYHDGLQKGRSVGAFISSLNNSLTSYYSQVAFHSNSGEMSTNFATNFGNSLIRYQAANKGNLPTRIIIYRDGVGEGMIGHVFATEVEGIKDQLRKVAGTDESKWPALCFTIVTKNINTRFFWKNREKGKLDNPPPGTVVDSIVTRPERFEFFLVSQSVRAGTVSPTCYNVIYNTTTLKATAQQQLAFKLTNLYYNWQGGVRVPAPCQYAHKLAYLVGTALHREHNNVLSDTLFYL